MPALLDVPEANIRKLAIERGLGAPGLRAPRPGHGPLADGRAEGRGGRADAAGDPGSKPQGPAQVARLGERRRARRTRLAWLLRVATVRLWADRVRQTGTSTDEPIATLAVGKTVRGIRYVRPGGTEAIEVADSKLLSAVDLPVADWREQVVMGVPTFQVASVTIKRAGQVIRAERDERGRWRLTAPVHAPANPAKIESLLAALSSLRVVDGEKGFVADNVKDFAPFGLAGSGSDRRADDDPAV